MLRLKCDVNWKLLDLSYSVVVLESWTCIHRTTPNLTITLEIYTISASRSGHWTMASGEARDLVLTLFPGGWHGCAYTGIQRVVDVNNETIHIIPGMATACVSWW